MTDTQTGHIETATSFWQTVREAIRGTHHDYTSGPIGRAIILLAVPMVLEMVMESVFAVVDVFWVGHLGPNAVATVGLTESMLTLVYTAAMGLSDLTSFWQTVREAIRGTHHDYTSGPIGRAIILLAVPMVLEMVMESVFAVVDVFWVAHLGPNAVATVGLTESMLTLVYTAAMGLSIGVTAMVARRIGEKNPEAAAEAAVQGIALGVIIAVIIAIIGALLAPRLLAIMGASSEVIALGRNYTRVMLGGNIVIVLLFLINAIFRGAGDAAIAMRVLWLANCINIILGPLLIFGVGPFARLGVTG